VRPWWFEKEVIKTVEVPGETIVKEVVKTVEVPGETVVIEKVVTETVEVPGETVVVEKVVTETVEVPKEVVVEKEVVKTVEVEVPREVVVEKEVEVVKTVVKEVAGKKYVTDPVIGNVIPAPEYGGTFAFASRNTFDRRMDPYVGGPSMSAIASGVMEKLGIVDWAIDRSTYSFGGYPPPVSAMIGSLAESWDASHNGTTYTFNIRPGVNFHNKAPVDGREMDAYDVEFSFHRMLGNKLTGSMYSDADPSPGAGSLGNLPWETVQATDKWTVQMDLSEPRFYGPRFTMDWYSMFVYPPEMVEAYGDDWDWDKVVGTGPYMITDLAPGTGITYSKNVDYYRDAGGAEARLYKDGQVQGSQGEGGYPETHRQECPHSGSYAGGRAVAHPGRRLRNHGEHIQLARAGSSLRGCAGSKRLPDGLRHKPVPGLHSSAEQSVYRSAVSLPGPQGPV
jgi:hypothetical protein